MTKDMMNLRALVEKSSDPDLLRDMIACGRAADGAGGGCGGPMSPESGFARPTAGSGIFPNDDSILVGALLFEHNDKWAVRRSRYRPGKRSLSER
jgi:hypothetical protein